MKLRIADFKGMIPARAPRLLPEICATVARNLLLETGELTPIGAPVQVHNFGSEVKTIYLDGTTWRGWQNEVDVVPGPIAADRLYLTGDGVPKMRVGGVTYPLAVPAPAAAPQIEIIGELDAATAENILFAYTYVTSLEEESTPSPVSDTVLWSPGCTARLTGLVPAPAGRLVTHIRIYRSQTGASGGTDLYFVAEIAHTAASFDHDVEIFPLQNPIPSMDYDAPPADLAHLTALPNGMMVAASGKTIRFCEPYLPHAWPLKYELAVDYEIVGFAAFGSSVAVMTKATPYMAQGITPDGMSLERVEQDLPCLSKRGIVDMGNAALYPSTEGLVMISAAGGQKVTQGLFTRKQWKALNPASFTAATYAGHYVFARLDGATKKMGMIRIEGGDMAFTEVDLWVNDLMQDAKSQDLYIVTETTKVSKFDAGANLTAIWRSKPLHLTSPTNFGAIYIEGTPPAAGRLFTARVYADGALARVVPSGDINRISRLPGNFLGEVWEIEVEANFPISTISIAETVAELADP